VPIDKVYRKYAHIRKPTDLPPGLIERITHFFQHYKDLEKGKWVKIKGWRSATAARKEIKDSLKRFNSASPRPQF
jgi:inorganic pyrophosphatase